MRVATLKLLHIAGRISIFPFVHFLRRFSPAAKLFNRKAVLFENCLRLSFQSQSVSAFPIVQCNFQLDRCPVNLFCLFVRPARNRSLFFSLLICLSLSLTSLCLFLYLFTFPSFSLSLWIVVYLQECCTRALLRQLWASVSCDRRREVWVELTFFLFRVLVRFRQIKIKQLCSKL